MAARYCSSSLASIVYDLQPRRLRSRFRAKNLREIFKGGSASPKRWQINRRRRRYQAATPRHVANAPGGAFHLKNDHGVPNAHEIFHARGVPVRKANATVTRGPANSLGIVCAVNANTRFV